MAKEAELSHDTFLLAVLSLPVMTHISLTRHSTWCPRS